MLSSGSSSSTFGLAPSVMTAPPVLPNRLALAVTAPKKSGAGPVVVLSATMVLINWNEPTV